MLAADNWCVKVDDKVYGPYTSQQLRKFAHEGRLASWSLISPAGSRHWRPAVEEATFASFFGAAAKAEPAQKRRFGRRDAEEAAAGAKDKAARATHDGQASLANFVIIFDVASAAASRVETAVLTLGPGFRITDNVWTIACSLTATGVRNAIAPYLLPSESIFIVDTTKGRTAWQNFSPELHAKLTTAWLANTRSAAKSA